MHSPPRLRRSIRLARAATLAGLAALAVATTAIAAPTSACGKRVIDDWYDNGRVDGTYEPHCYDDAIDALPRDVRDYSSAKEDITRALQARLRNEPAPPATTDPSQGGPDDPTDPDVQDPDDFDGDGIPNEDDGTPGVPRPGDPGGPEVVGSEVDTAASDSVPLPLLVLAGLALLLAAAGGVGYLARRLQARRLPPARRVPPTP